MMKERAYYRPIVIWLFTGMFLVMSMVILGGYTRLSGSGLSMADWKPISGWLPPLSDAEWAKEFELYKTTSEFINVNSHFTVEEFKSIFWPEFLHRLLGRVIGIVFIVPFVFFFIKGKFDRDLMVKSLVLFGLGGFQGFLGWFMVWSGLWEEPHVSHYRLAAHLVTALGVMMYIYWMILDIKSPRAQKKMSDRGMVKLARAFTAIVVIQILYGAFTAGLKAGFSYNTWPLMGNQFMASEVLYNGISDLFTHGPTVQFVHRIMAIFVLVMAFWIWFKRHSVDISYGAVRGINVMFGIVILQFALGVFTLLSVVDISLGVLHQAGAAVLLASAIYTVHES